MDAAKPRTRVVRRRCAPNRFPCPHCGKAGRRKQVHTRRVRDIAYREIVFIERTVGEYRARCSCCKTLRAPVERIEAHAAYTNAVRDAVIDRVLDEGMSMQRLQQTMRRDFHLDLSDGFLYDCLDWMVRQTDLADYRHWIRSSPLRAEVRVPCKGVLILAGAKPAR
jgi:transcription elongation factor Elf1